MNDKIKNLLLIFILTVFSFALLALLIPKYNDYMLHKPIKKIEPDVDDVLQQSILFLDTHGRFPEEKQLKLGNYIYKIKSWYNSSNNSNAQFGYVQGFINGPRIGLKQGYGGMFTCLVKKQNNAYKTKCFYQIKEM